MVQITNAPYSKLNRLNYFIVIVSCILCLVPFFILSIYVHPNAEDYSHSFLPRYSSTFYFVFDFFKNKEARLFTNLLYAINPLRFEAFWAYKLIPPVLLCGLYTALYFCIKTIAPYNSGKRSLWVLTLLILCLFLGLAPSPVHALYWMSSSFNYTTSIILLLLLLTVVFSAVRKLREGQVLKTGKLVYMVLLLYALVLSNEIFIFSLLFLVGILYLRTLIKRLPERNLFLLLLLAEVLASFIYFIPHVLIPEASHEVIHPEALPVSGALWLSLKNTLLNLLQWTFLNPPLLIFSVILFFYIRFNNGNLLRNVPLPATRGLFFYGLTAFVTLMLWLVPYYLFRGFEHIPQRIFNMQYFLFIPLWLYWVAAAASSHVPSVRPAGTPLKPLLTGLLVMAFSVSLVRAPNVIRAYSDLLGGSAKAYDLEIEQRLDAFEKAAQSPDRTAHIQVLRNRPFTIYFPPELEADSRKNIWNTAYENYFNLVDIKVSDSTHQITRTP
ncbi:MAG: hypothetical protein BWY70_00294 [Bacteroidetes bacterium ADurb.Bin408]|nr:MAG: hypothetical protein BWY70_00294 [Bacteroidetes bacterium ADurb.Bin408]